ncbi:oligomycin resistance ATP-dependent permease yor1 [Xylaria acuta]|nr:oligomycin resistance ATP-dependent permease yor1 [Xylaria acuta]
MILPNAITNISFQLGQCIVATVLAGTAVGYFAAVLPFVVFVLYLIQRFYLHTSRQLRLLELETSAPLFSHFIESLSGLVTIRAFRWTEGYTNKTNRLLDQSQKLIILSPLHSTMASPGLAVALRSRINPGLLGIALVQLASLSHALTALVQFWTLLETPLGAIARIKDFSDTSPEEASVSARYGDGPLILRDVSFSLKGGQKIGIVGRTGSGKSSTVQAILRIIAPKQGRILVDNVDLATLIGAVVREHVNTLTQGPFLFPASIRYNIDPLGAFSDEEISAALEKVKLWNILPDRAGGVDSTTDARMQEIIRDEFQDHTIIMIAHRLSSFLDFDLILVLDQGSVVESGNPIKLLRNSSSRFVDMYCESIGRSRGV